MSLLPAADSQPGETFEDLEQLYKTMVGQWTGEMDHVVAVVGGVNADTKHTGETGPVFTPVAKSRQKQAVEFLNDKAFVTPAWLVDPAILRRLEPAGAITRIRNAQVSLLNSLLASSRFTRLVEAETVDDPTAWSPVEFLTTVRKGIWKELDQPKTRIDAYRRNLQRAWLDIANLHTSGDEKAFYRAQLKSLESGIRIALPKTTDTETRAHLESVLEQLNLILTGKAPATVPVSTPASLISINSCWGN